MIFALDFFFLHDIPIPQARWRWASLPQQRLGGGEVRGERERRGEESLPHAPLICERFNFFSLVPRRCELSQNFIRQLNSL